MKKSLSLVLALVLALSLAACGNSATSQATSSASLPASQAETTSTTAKPTVDRSGAAIQLPDTVNRIVVLAPSLTETIVALGAGDKIIATDTQSTGFSGLNADLPALDISSPDIEMLASLSPDVVLVSSLSFPSGKNPLAPLENLGICVATVPTSSSIQGIKEDITFVAALVGKTAEGEKMNQDLQAEVDRIAAIGRTVTDKKKVYFEISAAPELYSFGNGVFLNEMLEIIGAENVFASQEGWLHVEPESAVAANPDVILTNVNYIDNPVEEILQREGWGNITAVQNKAVYYIDNMSSSVPNQNIVLALNEMAKAVYPDLYK